MLHICVRLLPLSLLLLTGCQMFDNKPTYSANNAALTQHLQNVNARNGIQSAKLQTHDTTTDTKTKKKAHYAYDDQKLSHEVLAALISQDELKNAHIRVAGYYGDILILGEVPSQHAVELAQNIAASFQDVKSIKTALTIGDNIPAGLRAEDSLTNTTVKNEIAKLDVQHSHLQVVTNGRKTFIVGPLNIDDQNTIKQHLGSLDVIDAVYFY